MNRKSQLTALAVILIVGGGVLLGLEAHKTVTLVVDGKKQTVETWSFTVGDFLTRLGFSPTSNDRYYPPAANWLSEDAVVLLDHAARFIVSTDTRAYNLVSTEDRAANILARAGIALYPGDVIFANGRPVEPAASLPESAEIKLEVERGWRITLTSGAKTMEILSTAATLGDALAASGFKLLPGDRLAPPANTPLTASLIVLHTPARDLTIQLGEEALALRSAAATVGTALAETGLALQGLDYSFPPPSDPIPADGVIRVFRVREEILLEQQPLPFETEFQPDPNTEIDTQSIIDTGVYGVSARRVRIRYEDGVEMARVTEGEWVAQQPKNRIVGYGTRVSKKTARVDGGTIEYWRAVPMFATSYSPCQLGVPNYCHDVTALGIKLQKGVAGVAKSWYSFTAGQRVYVPGYGNAVIADFGNGIPGRRLIDLGYSDSDYVRWSQNVTVYFLWPPPSAEQIVWVLP